MVVLSLLIGLWGLSFGLEGKCAFETFTEEADRSRLAQIAHDKSGRRYSKGFSARPGFEAGDFEGTFLLLHFWATWCPPCVAELPQLDRLADRFKGKNLSIVALSVDDGWPEIYELYSRLPRSPRFLTLLEPTQCWARFLGTTKYPETYLFGPDGRPIYHWKGQIDWSRSDIYSDVEQMMVSWSEGNRKTE